MLKNHYSVLYDHCLLTGVHRHIIINYIIIFPDSGSEDTGSKYIAYNFTIVYSAHLHISRSQKVLQTRTSMFGHTYTKLSTQCL